jgi:sugar-specific transcriptional regulator TrmB
LGKLARIKPTDMQNSLDHLGLDKHEAVIYQALLELGPSTVSQITKKAGITRTFGYPILEKLSEQGLVSKASGQGKKIHYAAQHPRRLVQYIENRKNQWERRLKEAENVLPDLVSIYKLAEKPTIRFQEGLEGAKSVYMESLESKEEILAIADIDSYDTPEFRKWGQEYNRQRSLLKIHEKLLLLDTPKARLWMENYKGSFKYTEFRWIRPDQLPGIMEFYGEINIFENKVLLMTVKKPNYMGVIIESKALAGIFKSLFGLAWLQGIPAQK